MRHSEKEQYVPIGAWMRRKPGSIVGSSPWSGQGLSEAADGVTLPCSGDVDPCPSGRPETSPQSPAAEAGSPCPPPLLHGPA